MKLTWVEEMKDYNIGSKKILEEEEEEEDNEAILWKLNT